MTADQTPAGGGNDVDQSGLPPGTIAFLDNFIPAAPPGRYTVSATHTVAGGMPAKGVKPQPPVPSTSYTGTQTFIIQGSRFVLNPAEIHAVFPPTGSSGAYGHRLAHIVLNKRALPWEHPLVDVDRSSPWLALLVLTPDQLVTSHFPPLTPPARRDSSSAAAMPLASVLSPTDASGGGATIVGPTLVLSPWEDLTALSVRAIDVPAATFNSFVPDLATARLSAHVRRVDIDDKADLQMKDDGWFAMVVGDRLPTMPTSGPAVPHIAHLVSLEGFEEYLGASQKPLADGSFARMISLASWSFSVEPEGASFTKLMNNLMTPASEQGTGWLLRHPITTGSADSTRSFAQRALAGGYTALPYQTRVGQETFCWYRGPLAAAPIAPALTDRAPRTSAAAMVYDPDHGVFDLSYAVAFQTGRLLALSSSGFSVSLMGWRRAANRVVDTLVSRARSPHLAALATDARPLGDRSVTQLRQLLRAPAPVRASFAAALTGPFHEHVAPHLASATSPAGGLRPPPIAVGRRILNNRPTTTWRDDVRSALTSPTVAALIHGTSDDSDDDDDDGSGGGPDPAVTFPNDLVTWLAKRAVLDGVPFDNLVARSEFLPPESIRFFHVDPNWVLTLLDGALSVGAQSTRDAAMSTLMRTNILAAVATALVPGATPTPDALPLMSGMLLRSTAVTGYRALQVRGFSDTNNGTPVPMLRLAELSPTVLLAVFAGVPAVVAIDESREGLGFGVEGDSAPLVELRHVNGASVGQPFPTRDQPTTLPVPMRGETGRIDLLTLANQITTGLGAQTAGQPVGPADLALNLVRIPEQFVWKVASGG